jgi:CheY-like chemotaxis protein
MKKHTILWADDDTDDLMLIREVLGGSHHQYDIVEVNNGKEVLTYLHEAKENNSFPCLIILDMNMPVLSGRDTLAILKSMDEFKSLPVVVFTTSNSELDRMFCKKYGVEMITKPPEFNALRDIVNKLLNMCHVS